MTQVEIKEKEGGWPSRCPQYWTKKIIRDRDRIISLPEKLLTMLNWLRRWNQHCKRPPVPLESSHPSDCQITKETQEDSTFPFIFTQLPKAQLNLKVAEIPYNNMVHNTCTYTHTYTHTQGRLEHCGIAEIKLHVSEQTRKNRAYHGSGQDM